MNQKSTKYFLIAGVLLIWGIIIYRVVKGLNNKEQIPVAKKKITPVNYNKAKDSFILYANYTDPFLHSPEMDTVETVASPPANPNQPLNIPGYTPPTNKPPFDINSIQYNGMIANPEKKNKVAFLTIAGREYTVKENDKVEGVLIRRITKDKIWIIINKKTEVIERKKE